MSVASALYKETCYVCEIVAKWFKKTFINLQRARQLSVNREVARQFHELGYDKEVNYYLSKMNDNTKEENNKKENNI